MSDVMDETKKKEDFQDPGQGTYLYICHNDSLCIFATVNELCNWIALIKSQKKNILILAIFRI